MSAVCLKGCEFPVMSLQTPKSTHHPTKSTLNIASAKLGVVRILPFFLASDNSHTTPQKIPPDEEGLLWGWCVVGGPLSLGEGLGRVQVGGGGWLLVGNEGKGEGGGDRQTNLSRSPSLLADTQGAWVGHTNRLAARNSTLNYPFFLWDFHREDL